ncbi:MAG TPA: protein kinase [Thermoanaerobaculia bacterium]
MRLSPGSCVGPYEILASLGAGATGEVYRARDGRGGREIAIRILEEELVRDRAAATRFERDVRAIAALTHPNIASILEFDVDAHPAFVAIELLEGQTLRQRIASRPSWQKAAAIGAEIAEGLGSAHDRGIAHRDLKPENVFFTHEGRVKILDFGIAHMKEAIAGDVPTGTQPGTELVASSGTTGYASPEQVRFEEPTFASDVFSLGVILYEMATGSNPFARETPVETNAAILGHAPAPLKDVIPDVPAGFARLVERCLEKNPDDRPESMRELAGELRDLLAEAEIERVFPGRSRRRRLAGAAAAAAGLLAIALIVAVWRGDVARMAGGDVDAADSVAVFPLAGSDPSTAHLRAGVTAAIVARLAEIDGLRVAAPPAVANRREIVREAGSDAVVTGRMDARNDRLLLDVTVGEGADGSALLRRSFTRERGRVAALPGDVAQAIARALGLRLARRESARLAEPLTASATAFEQWSRGLILRANETHAATAAAIAAFEAAVQADPQFARAHAALGEACLRHAAPAGSGAIRAKGRAAIARALAIDPRLAEGHVALGLLRLHDEWDLDAAEAEFRRAIELNPNLAAAHAQYALLLMYRGWAEPAIEEARRATAIEPLSRASTIVLATALLGAGKTDEAARELGLLLMADPDAAIAHAMMARVHAARGNGAGACIELVAARRLEGAGADELSALGAACADGGLDGYRRERIAVLLREGPADDPAEIARLYAALGETESAYRFLEAAFEDRTGGVLEVGIDPAFADLREDARVRSLLRRAGLLDRARERAPAQAGVTAASDRAADGAQ